MRSRLVGPALVDVHALRKILAELDDDLIVRVAEDGHLYLANRLTAERPTLRIRLDEPVPRLERVERRLR